MPTPPAPDLDTRRKRALYRATYRGTKEMDWLLGKFAAAMLPGMDGAALMHFEQFLALPDPDLNAWIYNPDVITGLQFADLVAALRTFHDMDQIKLDAPLTGSMTGPER